MIKQQQKEGSMRHKSLLAVTLSVVLGLGLSACEKKPAPPQTTADAVEQAPILLEVHSRISPLEFNLPECKGDQCVTVKVDYFESDYPLLDAAVNQYTYSYVKDVMRGFVENDSQPAEEDVKELNKATMQQALQSSIDRLVSLSQEAKELGSPAQLSLNVVPQVVEAKAPIATIVVSANNYMGGAHGSSAQQFINFDLNKRQIVNLASLIQEGKRAAFNDLAYQAFLDWVAEVDPEADLKAYQELWKFGVSDNFYLGKKGLALQYGEYEIGPYVMGLPRLIIPYDELQGIIKAEYLPKAAVADVSKTTHNP